MSQNFCILKLEETTVQMSLIPSVTRYEIVFLQALKACLSPQQEKKQVVFVKRGENISLDKAKLISDHV